MEPIQDNIETVREALTALDAMPEEVAALDRLVAERTELMRALAAAQAAIPFSDQLAEDYDVLVAERDRLKDKMLEWADIVDAHTGETTMTMQMGGFSPVRFMAEVRDFVRGELG
jgi:chemotaxis regulatin CheY-phosphate phosphatase CheZ